MLCSVLLVAAAATLVCFGPQASGQATPEEMVEQMKQDWLNTTKYPEIKLSADNLAFLNQILAALNLIPPKGVAGPRQECRTLKEDAKARLFGCFKTMAGSVRMVIIEAIHRSVIARNAHYGPCFPGWHRFYLAFVEEVLRKVCNDPTLSLCFWDVTLDARLPKPCQSAVFTPEYFGNEDGPVTSGPYANKKVLPDCAVGTTSTLTRACGLSPFGALSTENDITLFINAPNFRYLVTPFDVSKFEGNHGPNHNYIGGQMEMLTCSPADLIFFFFHTFIDYILDRYAKQRSANLYQEYPTDTDIPLVHRANAPLLPFFVDLLSAPFYKSCAEGLRYRTESTRYVKSVVDCNDHEDCGSKALWCYGEEPGKCAGCVREGANMDTDWPDRACYIQGCNTPSNVNGTCGCLDP